MSRDHFTFHFKMSIELDAHKLTWFNVKLRDNYVESSRISVILHHESII